MPAAVSLGFEIKLEIMVNRDKVRLMTTIARYKSQHEDIFKIDKYFGYDYIIWHLMLSALRYTIGVGLIFGMIVLLDSDVIFYNVNMEGITGTVKGYLFIYLIGLVLYLMLSSVVYSKRYKKAQKGILYYNSMLKRLAKRFNYKE